MTPLSVAWLFSATEGRRAAKGGRRATGGIIRIVASKPPESGPIEGNKALWDELVPIHLGSTFYNVEAFKKGASSLHDIELRELGEVRDKSLLHLQCHLGLDTISWSRLGARVIGVDFSPRSIEAARSLADEVGTEATFYCADLFDLEAIEQSTFDIVYTSYGVLPWLKDLRKWAEVVAHFVAAGGVFYMVEFHPVIEVFADSPTPELEGRYFFDDEPVEWKSNGTYAEPGAQVSNRSYQWHHPVGEVVSALIEAGLTIEFLHEHPDMHEQMRPWMVRDSEGRWRAPGNSLPSLFSLKAHKTK
jgi:SAM-dependent methyltransferase